MPVPVSVTDLVEPRPAYWREVHPLPPTPERAARLQQGREEHERIERVLAERKNVEVRVARDGIVGKVDLFDDKPTEVKTTRRLPQANHLIDERPEYVVQLGAYCALTGREEGRLILVVSGEDSTQGVEVFEAKFPDIDLVWRGVREQAEELRQALLRGALAKLPRCPWFDKGCEFREATVCDCDGSELASPLPRAWDAVVRQSPAATAEIVRKIMEAPPLEEPSFRFRELLYPRRAFFERTRPQPPEVASLRVRLRGGTYSRWLSVLEAGPVGEVRREWPEAREIDERVMMFRGAPVLLKITRSPFVATGSDILRDQPQYILELALRCAVVRSREGRLVVVHEATNTQAESVNVIRLEVVDLDAVVRELERRNHGLRRALSTGESPFGLPKCLAWMVAGCPYRATCGCGAPAAEEPAGRFQR